jgi:uncharacterized membrane protein
VNAVRLVWVGFAVIFVGFLVAALGTFQSQGGSSSAGGFILIGPVPIIFGGGQGSGTLVTVAIVVSAVMIAMYLASFLLSWRAGMRQEEADPRRQD